jgi:NADP-dependent 3-hydroxy acid dehydrogenase YdfG
LKSEDIADSVLYILSTPPHVQVRYYTLGAKLI